MSFFDSLLSIVRRIRLPIRRVPTFNVRFIGWSNEEARKRSGDPDGSGAGSLHYYLDEVAAGRKMHAFPAGLFFVDGLASEVEGVGFVPGSEIQIAYDPEKISQGAVIEYMKSLGIETELILTSSKVE